MDDILVFQTDLDLRRCSANLSRLITGELFIFSQQSIMDPSASQQHVNWPSATGNPINKFTTEGYISCAFPTLFPTGTAASGEYHKVVVSCVSYSWPHIVTYL